MPVNPGTYTAGETLLSGYTFDGFSGDCDINGDVTVALGQSKTCTLTNSDQQATITVVKVVHNTHGGTASPNDFNLTLEGNAVTSGVAVPVNPGTYTAGIAIESNDPQTPIITLPVTLTVTAACESPWIHAIMITPPDPVVGEVNTFSADATGTGPLAYAWDFGDGEIATGEEVTHSYNQAGTYLVTLSVSNACGADQKSFELTIEAILQNILLPIIRR